MNVRDRYKAKQEAKEEAYYKGLEAPQTKMVDTGNGFTEVQTNTDKNEPVNEPQKKQTTLQNYKPVQSVEEKPVEQPQVVGNAEVPSTETPQQQPQP